MRPSKLSLCRLSPVFTPQSLDLRQQQYVLLSGIPGCISLKAYSTSKFLTHQELWKPALSRIKVSQMQSCPVMRVQQHRHWDGVSLKNENTLMNLNLMHHDNEFRYIHSCNAGKIISRD